MNNTNVKNDNATSCKEPMFAVGNRREIFNIARDTWGFVNKSRTSIDNNRSIIGTIISVVSTVVSIVGSTVSLAGTIADQNASLPNNLQVSLRIQNLTTSVITISGLGHSNTRVATSPCIMPGQTVEYPVIFSGQRTGQLMTHLNLVNENGVLRRFSLVVINNPSDVRVRTAFMDNIEMNSPNNINIRENRPMIYRDSKSTIYCTSVMGSVTNQVSNIDISILDR